MVLAGVTFAGLAIAGAIAARQIPGGTAGAPGLRNYDDGLRTFDVRLRELDAALASGDVVAARGAFRRARAAYKRIELFVEYYAMSEVRELNGVPMKKAEDEDPETPLAPVGLQMVEAALFPGDDPMARGSARKYVEYMHGAVASLRRAGVDTMPGDAHLFDAMRQEIARVSTLGIAGFDATASGDAIVEAADALRGVEDAMLQYRTPRTPPPVRVALDASRAALDSAIANLVSHPDFDSFDRARFISRYVVPAAHRLAAAQQALGVGPPRKPRAWSSRAPSIFDRGALDPAFFAATDAPPPSAELISLGRDLFFDPTLSPSGARSCASCHLPAKAFTDGRRRALLLSAHRAGHAPRNTPTLLNAALQPTLFADGRVRTLEDQATDVIGNAAEMGGSLDLAAAALRARAGYTGRFARAFGEPADRALSARTLRLALAAYVRSLVALDSRFDRAVRGEDAALTVEERHGFDLFMGKAKCGTCHFAPLFNGATPPMLVESEPEVIGVPARAVHRHARIDPDSGRFNVRRIDQHLHAFRTPTLRNVALTAPYMHNGVFTTLEQVLDFYDAGGGQGIGSGLPHQTLPRDSLHLSAAEKRAVIAFLRSLTDTTGTAPLP